ncbi:MAG TPA: hypothetical protein PK292_10910, partial [Termitinemataceae bacterium]|nr:hypothetical protein [Termitinemataceae bacterium]
YFLCASPVVSYEAGVISTMTFKEAVSIVEGTFFWGDELADSIELRAACGADLMSDVMAFVKEQVLLLTGLVNPQVIRTAELMDIRAILFVRGKKPTPDMVDMARDAGIALAGTREPMFIACGKLYEAGLRSGGTRSI